MLSQTISSDLLVDLSPEKQQILSGGCRSKYACRKPIREEQPISEEQPMREETSPISSQPSARMVVGNIITVTPFAKCLPGSTC